MVKQIGPLRILLLALGLFFILLAQDSHTQISFDGLDVFFTLIMPAMVPILFMVLAFDIIMLYVRKSSEEDEKSKIILSKTIWFSQIILVLIVLRWYGYFYSLFS